MARQTALPLSLPPRLVTREAAAAYASLSPTTFDEMVREGNMPPPCLLRGRRKAWDVRRLDMAIDALQLDGADRADTSWDD